MRNLEGGSSADVISRSAGAILVAHVGMDSAPGYALKFPTGFHDTHLGRIGRG